MLHVIKLTGTYTRIAYQTQTYYLNLLPFIMRLHNILPYILGVNLGILFYILFPVKEYINKFQNSFLFVF